MGATYYPNAGRGVDDWDDVFEALAAEPRRRLLASLLEAERGEAVHLPEAATAPEAGADPEKMRVELYHRHLPALAEAGFVDWETDPLVATRGPDFPAVAAVLEALDSEAVLRSGSPSVDGGGRTDGRQVDSGPF